MLSNRYCALIDCVSESCSKYGAMFFISLVLSDWADWSNRTEQNTVDELCPSCSWVPRLDGMQPEMDSWKDQVV